MAKPVIHLCSIAGPSRALRDRLGVRTFRRMIDLAAEAVAPGYRVTGSTALLNPRFDERRGGRRDDDARREDLLRALADDAVRAIVAVRGGAWLTRILPEIDFDVLQRRTQPVWLFGFSEFTTLVNIVGAYPAARAYYDQDLGHLLPGAGDYRAAYVGFLRDLVEIIEGRSSARPLAGRLAQGSLPKRLRVRVVGGCLSVLVCLYGSRFQPCVDPRDRWLALEDAHDEPAETDRRLAQLKLAGVFETCGGLLLGDFHVGDDDEGREDQTAAVLSLLKFHLPRDRVVPIVAHCNFGHCHPVGPLPINRDVTLVRGAGPRAREVAIVEG